MPHDSPLHDVHSHGSAEGSVQQHDLMVLVTKLNDRIDGLEKDLQQTKKTYSTTLTKLVLRVKKLEYKLKSRMARRKAKIVLSDDEEIAEDSSDPTISLVQDEGISWIPQEEEVHEKPSDETKALIQEYTPTKIIEEHESGEKGEMEISTANIQVSIASPPKKVKKRTQVQLSMDEELAKKMEEEERLNLEAARELQRQLDQRQEVPTQPTQSQGIDWNDPSFMEQFWKRHGKRCSFWRKNDKIDVLLERNDMAYSPSLIRRIKLLQYASIPISVSISDTTY
ncbi:hypothetical protein Tco_0874227 [Tanacetum coccineum]|uniref:Uncharacterized protein n=1 Tax=Tanacetum coccineum TaxID=301880 RepID=A0ABQ5BLE0_9ASTR